MPPETPRGCTTITQCSVVLFLSLDRPMEAEECYRRAMSIKSDHINANTNMGHLCRLQERWEEARAHYTTAGQRRPNNFLLHYYIGFVSERIGTSLDIQVEYFVYLFVCCLSVCLFVCLFVVCVCGFFSFLGQVL